MKQLQAIQETSYLTAVNAPQYRKIMRIFYQEYERMNFQLYKEDVFELIKTDPEFLDYTMDQLKNDLTALVEWKNLIPIQDPKRVYTIAEYKNKQFRYSMSEYAVEIERLTVKLENLHLKSNSLSANLFQRLEEDLEHIKNAETMQRKEINQWWHNLLDDFKRLNQNYQDYLREFYSGRAEKVLKSMEFILHKDKFITYLKEFIQELQINATRIENTLKQIENEDHILENVILGELDTMHPFHEETQAIKDGVRENVYGKWRALKNWFLTEGMHQSESSRVMDITDDIIRKIIQNAALIVQLQNWGISRKDDYKKFIELFHQCGSIDEAHKLSAHIFGIQHVKHFRKNMERSTDSINSSTYEEEAMEFLIRPRVRTYRPRVERTGFDNKAMEKLAYRNTYLKQVEEDKKMVMKYVKDNKLELSQITENITENTRLTLLRWICAANTTNTKKGRTEYGQEYRLIKTDEICTLKCEDGDLKMPAYIFEFLEEFHERNQNTN